ncbi:hypothetical protein [Rhizobium sp. RAF56]|jgi:hypothetical protein|uniref:hypothetical protein n=1 Tax=Rhizobium sp. RAF56 TaxID=3233062 RepID=UPI003F98C165
MDDRAIIFSYFQSALGRMQYWQDERSKTTTLVVAAITILSAAIGYDQKIAGAADAFLALVVIVVGIIGLLFVLKTHERVIFFREVSDSLLKDLNVASIAAAIEASGAFCAGKYRFAHRLKLYDVYLFMMMAFVVYGVALLFIATGLTGIKPPAG